jgi:hypothetical protein
LGLCGRRPRIWRRHPPLVWYRFTADRSGLHPQRELVAFSGHLQADAYAGYNKLYESRLSPRSELATACRYGVKLWPALTRFIDNGQLEIDNGVAEHALRGVALGRRNWLFAGSTAGGFRAAAIYTVIETCKANGVDPQAYIADVMAKVAAGRPAARWDEIMPWNWAAEPVRLAA